MFSLLYFFPPTLRPARTNRLIFFSKNWKLINPFRDEIKGIDKKVLVLKKSTTPLPQKTCH